MLTAQTSNQILANNLRRGFDELCIEIKKEEAYLEPPALYTSYVNRKRQLEQQSAHTHKLMGSPNKANLKKWRGRVKEHDCGDLLQIYFDIADQITLINESLAKIRSKVRQTTLSYTTVFMGVAREVLDEDIFKRIELKTSELINTGFTGSRKEWEQFVSTLD